MFFEISQNSQKITCARVSFLIKLQAWVCNFIEKEALAQAFSFEFCEISKNTFFTEHLRWLLLNMVWGNEIAVLICEVNGTEINFEFKLSKSARSLRGLILMTADFYKFKKNKKQKKNCSSRGVVFTNVSFSNSFSRIFFQQKFLGALTFAN